MLIKQCIHPGKDNFSYFGLWNVDSRDFHSIIRWGSSHFNNVHCSTFILEF